MDGFSQVLAEDCGEHLDSDANDYLARIRKSTKLMGELIDDLLSLSRISSRDVHRKEVNLGSFAQR